MKHKNNLFLCICSLLTLCAQTYLHAATLIVDNTGATPGSYITIQAAYVAASTSHTDTILRTAGQTFTGTGNYNITIDKNLILNSTDTARTNPIIDMHGSGTFCSINTNKTVVMNNLTLTGGYTPDSGGAIVNNGTLSTFSCTFSNNHAQIAGGAILTPSSGTLNITDCTFINNDALYEAGVIEFNGNTANITHCTFSNNSAPNGGAIYNTSTLNATDCTFSNNLATTSNGGAIYNHWILNALTCTFNNNNASFSGGAIYNINTEATINCCRFASNTARYGNAICNEGGIVNAINNWWGTNSPNATTLFIGIVTYTPWITMSITTDPALVLPGEQLMFTATFSSSCIPDGTPVLFRTTDGTITPTSSSTLNGQCSATLSDFYAAAQACATTDSQTLCTTINAGLSRFNFECVCSDTGNEHLLVGVYNDPNLEHNKLLGYLFDTSSSTTTTLPPLDLGAQLIYNVAVYNVNNNSYIALLTKQDNNYYLRLAVAAKNNADYTFTLSTTLKTLNYPTS
jgi:predicted outer membrane repeat protein